MSTHYRALQAPITSVRVEDRGAHSLVTLWANHANIGTLTLSIDEEMDFLRLLSNGESVAQTTATAEGPRLRIFAPVNDDQCLVSENGKLTTLGKLKSLYPLINETVSTVSQSLTLPPSVPTTEPA